ncbi:LysR family transcriptional regulator [Halalkalibacter urbisdiaboli]|uniref:LysR family transcriptional regulator n=1 Tax=Halalkalibacter urbisdiaboli TaxID=1960589 RepID=UPI000B439246|nr:LysR family transcriptional regulator [Halalkalibacter urbisdiaboli]
MEWQQLAYFQRVATLQHFTKAAESLFISQPALSRSISRLEKELGVPLFERQGRSVQLNRYGQLFLEKVNVALQIIEDGQQEIKERVSPESGNIALSFMHTLGSELVPELIGKYRETHPGVTFQLFQNTANRLMDQLQAGDIDLCLTTVSELTPEICWIELFSERLYVIVPDSHYLANQTEVKLSELAEESFIGFKKGVGLRTITDHLCQEVGFTPRLTFEGQEVGTITGLVSAGLGVALVPERIGIEHYAIQKLSVVDVECSRTIGLAWKERAFVPKVVEQFREFVLAHFKNIEESKR